MSTVSGIDAIYRVHIGGCYVKENLIRYKATPTPIFFPASCFLIKTQKQWSMVDCGYSEGILKRHWGLAIYRRIMTIEDYQLDLISAFDKLGITPTDIKTVYLTHVHPDHIGHLYRFHHAHWIMTEVAYRQLLRWQRIKPMKEAMIGSISSNITTINYSKQLEIEGVSFNAFPLNSEMIALDLSGHSRQMMGIFFPQKKLILAIDANWRKDWMSSEALKRYTFAARMVQNNWQQYQETNQKLSLLSEKGYRIELTHDNQSELRLF